MRSARIPSEWWVEMNSVQAQKHFYLDHSICFFAALRKTWMLCPGRLQFLVLPEVGCQLHQPRPCCLPVFPPPPPTWAAAPACNAPGIGCGWLNPTFYFFGLKNVWLHFAAVPSHSGGRSHRRWIPKLFQAFLHFRLMLPLPSQMLSVSYVKAIRVSEFAWSTYSLLKISTLPL